MSADDSITSVEYRAIADLIGYRFGNDGAVQSCWAGRGPGRTYLSTEWRNLVLTRNSMGYPCVCMKRRGKYRVLIVHQLIAEAFLGPRPPGMFVCHNDGNPWNNRIENLRHDTHQGNEDDKKIHGTRPRGTKSKLAKLDDDQVREIRRLRAVEGITVTELGRRYGVHHGNISDICNRKIWKHLE